MCQRRLPIAAPDHPDQWRVNAQQARQARRAHIVLVQPASQGVHRGDFGRIELRAQLRVPDHTINQYEILRQTREYQEPVDRERIERDLPPQFHGLDAAPYYLANLKAQATTLGRTDGSKLLMPKQTADACKWRDSNLN